MHLGPQNFKKYITFLRYNKELLVQLYKGLPFSVGLWGWRCPRPNVYNLANKSVLTLLDAIQNCQTGRFLSHLRLIFQKVFFVFFLQNKNLIHVHKRLIRSQLDIPVQSSEVLRFSKPWVPPFRINQFRVAQTRTEFLSIPLSIWREGGSPAQTLRDVIAAAHRDLIVLWRHTFLTLSFHFLIFLHFFFSSLIFSFSFINSGSCPFFLIYLYYLLKILDFILFYRHISFILCLFLSFYLTSSTREQASRKPAKFEISPSHGLWRLKTPSLFISIYFLFIFLHFISSFSILSSISSSYFFINSEPSIFPLFPLLSLSFLFLHIQSQKWASMY